MKKSNRTKKTLSIRQFVAEYGENFSKHMKKRISELGTRCVLTRKDMDYVLDLKHVEHTKYSCCDSHGNSYADKKEYVYGEFVVNDGALYFSDRCLDSDSAMQVPTVKIIYDTLNSKVKSIGEYADVKEIGDDNIDYVIDSILEVCPQLSPEHMQIISRYYSIDGGSGKGTKY
ncbi:MAG: hypothetical protein ACM3TR_02440 [Caulobacteraceae bacterium]